MIDPKRQTKIQAFGVFLICRSQNDSIGRTEIKKNQSKHFANNRLKMPKEKINSKKTELIKEIEHAESSRDHWKEKYSELERVYVSLLFLGNQVDNVVKGSVLEKKMGKFECKKCKNPLLNQDVKAAPCGHLFHTKCLYDTVKAEAPRCVECGRLVKIILK